MTRLKRALGYVMGYTVTMAALMGTAFAFGWVTHTGIFAN